MSEPNEPGLPAGQPVTTETIPLAVEEIEISRRQRETSVLRVQVETQVREERIDMMLMHQQADVTRVPIGQYVGAIPPVREEGDVTIIPVVEEILVVERRLLLREEVHVRKVQTTNRHIETVPLRHQEAVITRRQGGASSEQTDSTLENEHE
jgi:stress response protein YsnF